KVRALFQLRYGNATRLVVQYAERDMVKGAIGSGCFTDRMPGFIMEQTVHQRGEHIIVAGLAAGDIEPSGMTDTQILDDVDATMSSVVGRPIKRVAGFVKSWTHDPWSRAVVRAPIGDQRDTVLPLIAAPIDGRVFIASVLGPGDEVLVATNGLFGDRMADVATANGMKVHRVRPELAHAVTAAQVREALDEHPEVRAVCVVHHETSVGVLNEVQGICAVAREHGALTIVDGISSVGGVPFDMDGWGADMCVTVANKCIGGAIGVAPLAAGPRALEA